MRWLVVDFKSGSGLYLESENDNDADTARVYFGKGYCADSSGDDEGLWAITCGINLQVVATV